MGKEKQIQITYVCQSSDLDSDKKEAAQFELDKVTRYIWGQLAPETARELITSEPEIKPVAD